MTESALQEIATPQGVLRYYDHGTGPALLFLHGSGPGVTWWRNSRGVLPTFAAQGVMPPFLDALGIGKVHIVGNSMGGGVGVNFAIHHPDRIGRLVTIGGIGTSVFSPGLSEGIRLLQEFTEDPTRQRLIDWLRSMVYDEALVTDDLIDERWRLATDPATLAAARRMYGKAAFESAVLAFLQR